VSAGLTKEKLLDAAEVLFAEHGFDATSVRDITRRAEANLASVNYHFGSKEELLAAVFARRVGPINLERLELLEQLQQRYAQQNRQVPLVELSRALLAPALSRIGELTSGSGQFLRLVGRAHSDSNAKMRLIFKEQFTEVFHRFLVAFQQSATHLNQLVLMQRLHFMVGAMAHVMAMSSTEDDESLGISLNPEHVMEELIHCCTAMLEAAPIEGSAS